MAARTHSSQSKADTPHSKQLRSSWRAQNIFKNIEKLQLIPLLTLTTVQNILMCLNLFVMLLLALYNALCSVEDVIVNTRVQPNGAMQKWLSKDFILLGKTGIYLSFQLII